MVTTKWVPTAPRAATVLHMNAAGEVLAVSRKNNPSDFGLPGGRVDPGETDAETAARELLEETGLTATNLRPVFSQEDDHGFITTVFMGDIAGEIRTEEAGVVRWVAPSVLFAGCFGGYLRKLFAALGLPS